MSTSVPPPGYEPPRTYAPVVPAEEAPAAAPRAARPVALRSKLLVGGLGLLAAVGVVFVLFGSASSNVTDPIAQAATLSSHTPGYRMRMYMTMDVPGVSQAVTASGNAVVDLRDQAASMSFAVDFGQDVDGLGTSMRLKMIFENGIMYMEFPTALTNAVPTFEGKQWVELNLAKIAGLPGLSSLGKGDEMMSDPSHMLQYLHGASDSVVDEGQQVVDGVVTTHYHAMLDLDRLAADVPSAEQALVQRALSQLEQSTNLHQLPIDVWIDAQHLVRREVMTISIPVDGSVMQETVEGDLSDYGQQPRPTPPPSDQVVDLSSLANLGH